MSEMSFFATHLAVDKAKAQLRSREKPALGLRIGVLGSGCNGLNYKIEFAESIRDKDHVFEFDGLKIVIDPKSYVYLSGSTLDWKSTLIEHGFCFENPNAKTVCGCGSSFNI